MSQKLDTHSVLPFDLENGHRLVVVRAGLPIGSVSMWFDRGSRYDPAGKEGLAHFVEHLHMKTSDRFASVDAARAYAAGQGIHQSAFTSPEHVWFGYEMASNELLAALDGFAHVAVHSTVTKDAFQQERSVIADERWREEKSPEKRMATLLRAALYPSSGLARTNLGSATSLERITYEDVAAFTRSNFIEAKKTFVVCGSQTPSEIIPVFERLSAAVPTETASDPILHAPERLIVAQEEGDFVHVGIGFSIFGLDHTENMAVMSCLGQMYLCSGQASRLFKRLRDEKHLTYAVRGSANYYDGAGVFSITYTAPRDRLIESLAICFEEIEKLRSGDVDEDLLAASKRWVRFNFLRNSVDPSFLASWYGPRSIGGRIPKTIDQYLAEVDKVSMQDVTRVANDYLVPERRSLVVIGNVDEDAVRNFVS